ncbi:type II secretion system protein [Cellvibrio sp. OA-2007]|uniref:type II secretion system protein n=1 Tax=Cellvibrio sp. OA-2007 TaxID=529823 RepID=UPI000A02B7F0|nr:type II secretion system protein [Cellvibrio sp. OA-2007]
MKMTLFPKVGLRSQSAFTLIEMLVVLIIVAMVVTVVMQGFGYSLGLYQRVVKNQASAYQQAFAYRWFASTLQSQVAMRPKDLGLEGNQDQLSTYTYNALLENSGVKTRIAWELNIKGGNLVLGYREGAQHFIVNTWAGAKGQFQYLDLEKKWRDRWLSSKGEPMALPSAIRLQVRQGDKLLNFVVATETRLRAIITADEKMYGRE